MRAVLVFCEGNHDVEFAKRSLAVVAGARLRTEPIKSLPSPFGPGAASKSVISLHYASRALDTVSLRAAAHSAPPTFEALLELDGTLFCLINCHGDGAAATAMKLLSDIESQLPFGVDVTDLAAAFLFDADAQGLGPRTARFAADHGPLLRPGVAPAHATWVRGTTVPVGLYVFHDQATQTGTLEDILSPMVGAEWPARWQAAGSYVSMHALPGDPVLRTTAEQLKAQICITGQFLFPGDPMTQVLGRDGLPRSHFNGVDSQALVSFLLSAPWPPRSGDPQ